MKTARAAVFVAFVCFPLLLSAQVRFSEIMYDFPGTEGQGDHDFVEVWNSGSAAVNISAYRFYEANTNHLLKLDRGNATLAPGAFAVIANATSTFLSDFPQFGGTLFDSSFNLNGTGELLKFCSGSCSAPGSVVEDELTYVPLESASNNGDSLQLSSGAWVAAAPTPGAAAASSGAALEESATPAEPDASESDASGSSGSGSSFPVEPRIFAYAGADKLVIVGADSIFEGKALGLKKEPLMGARFLWNFGDGASAEGERVFHHYENPGSYAVALSVSSDKYSALARMNVKAEAARVFISAVTPSYIEITNGENHELDLSRWLLRSGVLQFILPEHTILLPRASVRFSSGTTGLSGEEAQLLYPNGVAASAPDTRQKPLAPAKPASPASAESRTVPEAAPASPAREQVALAAPEYALAAAVEASPESGSNPYLWLSGLAGLLVLAGGASVYIRREARSEIEIIEE